MKTPADNSDETLLVRRRVRRAKNRGARRLVRALKRVCACALVLALVVWLGTMALRPFLLDRQQVSQLRQLEAEVAAAEAQNQALRQRVRVLNTPKGIEVEARRNGWVRPGEILIQTTEIPPPTPTKLPEGATEAPALGAVHTERGSLRRALKRASDTWVRLRGGHPTPDPLPSSAAKELPQPGGDEGAHPEKR